VDRAPTQRRPTPKPAGLGFEDGEYFAAVR
jgi:hypothetical protein